MTIFKVISVLPIDGNTSVIVEGDGKAFKNGIGVLDSAGKPFEVLSVGMTSGSNVRDLLNSTMLLVKGKFDSETMYV